MRRLGLLSFVLIGVTVLVFILSYTISNPAYLYVGDKTSKAAVEAIIKKYDLNAPLPIQYFRYLQNLLTGNWGYSVSAEQPVLQALAERFPFTAELAISSSLLTIVIAIPLGIVSAIKNNTAVDHLSRIFSLIGLSFPTFWLGLLLKTVFSYDFKAFGLPNLPLGGAYSQILALEYPKGISPGITGMPVLDTFLTGNWIMFNDSVTHLILPMVTLAFVNIGTITRIMRSSMLEVLNQDYITLARSKGLKESVIIWRHALRNAMGPTLTLFGLLVGALLAGAPITEYIFQWPGIGYMAVTAILASDVSMIMGFVLLSALLVVVSNLVVDVLYTYFDPRVRY